MELNRVGKWLLTIALVISAFTANSQEIVNGYRRFNFTSVNGTFAEGRNTAGVTWGAGTGFAVGTKTLPSTYDGEFQAEYQGSGYGDVVIGFNSTSTAEDYTGFAVGVYIEVSSTTYKTFLAGGSTASGITAVAGDLFKLKRAGTVWTAEYYRGGTWTIIRTFTAYTSTAQQWPKTSIATGGNNLLNPTGKNLF